MNEEEFKKIKKYSDVALLSSILLIIFGFGFGLVNMAFFLIAIALAILGLTKNKSNIKSVKIKCISAIIIILIAISFYLIGFPNFIDFIVNPYSLEKIDEITKPLFQ